MKLNELTGPVYIIGPYTHGSPEGNVQRALVAADLLVKHGYLPFIPHLTHYWHVASPKPYDFWLFYDNHFLRMCPMYVVIQGYSPGGKRETEQAEKYGLIRLHDVEDVINQTLKGEYDEGTK